MEFCTPLDIRAYKTDEFVLLDDFCVVFRIDDQRYEMRVPKGFITDFASVPGIIQLIPGFDVNGDSRNAAVVHDWTYCCHGVLRVNNMGGGLNEILQLNRQGCDQLLRDGLISSGYSPVVANMFYAGVRLGGASHWNYRHAGLISHYDFVPESYWSTAP